MEIIVTLSNELALELEASGLDEEEIAAALVAYAGSHMLARAKKIIATNRPAATPTELKEMKAKAISDKADRKAAKEAKQV